MEFKLIDISKWDRREYFEHYLNQLPCTYSMTLNLDLTILLQEIKKRNLKLYPTIIYLLSTIVNKHEEFRTSIDTNNHIGVFDRLHPSYTIFQKDHETFANIWTEYTPSFSEFYKQYLLDVENYGKIKKFIAKPNSPSNIFTISSIPWVAFTGFHLNLPTATRYLLPIFTTGKYFEQNGKIWLPIAIQVHHAVCDGFHAARFVNELQETVNHFF
ncbi:MAG: type A chloramphenicol O-acetyltransferase [Parachlamydiaceae bacterium]